MTNFPTEFPSQAVAQVAKFVQKKDQDKGRLALAVYEIIGFVGFKVFGDVKYLMGDIDLTKVDIPTLLAKLEEFIPLAMILVSGGPFAKIAAAAKVVKVAVEIYHLLQDQKS